MTLPPPPGLPRVNIGVPVDTRFCVTLKMPGFSAVSLRWAFPSEARQNLIVLSVTDTDGIQKSYQLAAQHGGAALENTYVLQNTLDDKVTWLMSSWEILTGGDWNNLTTQGGIHGEIDGYKGTCVFFTRFGQGPPQGSEISSVSFQQLSQFGAAQLMDRNTSLMSQDKLEISRSAEIDLDFNADGVTVYDAICLTVETTNPPGTSDWLLWAYEPGHPPPKEHVTFINSFNQEIDFYISGWERRGSHDPGYWQNQANIRWGESVHDGAKFDFLSALEGGVVLSKVSYRKPEIKKKKLGRRPRKP